MRLQMPDQAVTGHAGLFTYSALGGRSSCTGLLHGRARQAAGRARLRLRGGGLMRHNFRVSAQIQLVQPTAIEAADERPLLLYLPGTDGTGNAITPQLPALVAAGFDIRALYISMDDRSSWDELTGQLIPLIRDVLAHSRQRRRVTIVAESFGGCLALRAALAAPELVERMVLVNPATCFDTSYFGLIGLIARTNLLSVFPERMYQVAQAVLIPLLVDKEKVGSSALRSIKSMMAMQPPPSFQTGQGYVTVTEPKRRKLLEGPQGFQWYLPSATASWRLGLLRQGNLPDEMLRRISTPTLLLASGEDRLLASMREAVRLQQLLPTAQRVVLPDSGHTALLEADVNLTAIMQRAHFLPEGISPPNKSVLVSSGGTAIASVSGSTDGGSSSAYRVGPSVSPTPAAGADLGTDVSLDAGEGADIRVGSRPNPPSFSNGASVRQDRRQTADVVRLAQVSTTAMQQPLGAGPGAVLQMERDASPASSLAASANRGRSSDLAAAIQQCSSLPGPETGAMLAADAQEGVRGSTDSLLQQPAARASAAASRDSGAPPSSQPAMQSWVEQQVVDRFSNGMSADQSASFSIATSIRPPSFYSNGRPGSRAVGRQQGSRVNDTAGAVAAAAAAAAQGRQGGSSGTLDQQKPLADPAGSRRQWPNTSSASSWARVDETFEFARRLLEPWRSLVAPHVTGEEHLPDPLGPRRPLLFVGNHTLFGLYDLPVLVDLLYMRGFKVRGLAHPQHWRLPTGALFEAVGAVKASPMAAYRLLREGESVLLFPGGGREVNKRKDEKYKLLWRDTPDFVRMAAKLDALIIPFAAVGADDAYDIAYDSGDILAGPLGPLARQFVANQFPGESAEEMIPPIARLPGTALPSLLPLPRIERLYFRFMEPVDAKQQLPDVSDADAAMRLYQGIKRTVEQGITDTQAIQQADPDRQLGPRLMSSLGKLLPAFDFMQEALD